MPEITSQEGYRIVYDLHDFTDPWRDAQTIILQHGFGRSGRMWFGLVPHLARHYRVLCPDMRGLGRSCEKFEPDSVTVENLLEDLVRSSRRFSTVTESGSNFSHERPNPRISGQRTL